MKKLFTLGAAFLFMVYFVAAQQQLQNPGFEDWEDINYGLEEPVDWSSIKTSDGGDIINAAAPVVWEQSDDAHSGNYSIKLFNVSIFSIVATGTLTNGRVHADYDPEAGYVFTDPEDEQWHTSLTDRPDSVAFWVKYSPRLDDSATVQVLLHIDEGTLPPTPENMANWIAFAEIKIGGTYDTWTKFTAPFTYFCTGDPEYVLVVLTSGNGTTPVEGSYALFDDIELIYDPSGIEDNPMADVYIFTDGENIYMENMPKDFYMNATIDIISLSGNKVLSSRINSNQINISQSAVSKGIYIVRIVGQNKVYTQKLLIH